VQRSCTEGLRSLTESRFKMLEMEKKSPDHGEEENRCSRNHKHKIRARTTVLALPMGDAREKS